MVILVVGGTGHVGKQIALTLAKQNLNINALVRGGRSHASAAELAAAGVQIIEGDLRNAASLKNAIQNTDAVICTATSMPAASDDGIRAVDHDGILSLIETAEAQGVKRFMYVSYSGNIRFDSPLERAKRGCENRLIQSRMESVILRPSYFMEMWLSPMLSFDPTNGTARIYGDGHAKLSYISCSNVADFAVAVATAPPTGKRSVLELGGPEPLSQLDVVRAFEDAFGKQIKCEHLPIEAMRAQHQSPDPLQQTFAALMLGYANGDEVPGAIATAQQYQVRLTSVAEYASRLASQMSVV